MKHFFMIVYMVMGLVVAAGLGIKHAERCGNAYDWYKYPGFVVFWPIIFVIPQAFVYEGLEWEPKDCEID